jgi:hypothetical protein
MIAHARTSHPIESHQAAARVKVNLGQEHALRALRLFGLNGGPNSATADQVRDLIRRTGNKASDSGPRSRLAELKKMGLVRVVSHDANRHAIYALTIAGQVKANELARIAKAERRTEQLAA